MEPEDIVPRQATRYMRNMAADPPPPPTPPSPSPTTTSSSKKPPKLCPLSHKEQFPGCISSLFPDTRRPSLLTLSISSTPSSPSSPSSPSTSSKSSSPASSSPSFTSFTSSTSPCSCEDEQITQTRTLPAPPSPTSTPCVVPTGTYDPAKPLPAGQTFCALLTAPNDALPPQVITVASVDPATTQSTTFFDARTSATYVPSPSGPSNYEEDAAWQPPHHYNIVAVAVTVPIICVALLGVFAWYLYRRRRHSSTDAPSGTTMTSNSATPDGGRGAGGLSSSALAAMNIWHKPDFSRTRAANRNSIIAGLGLGREDEDDRRWTMRGYRAYGDGVRRPPPVSPLAAAILRRGGSGDGEGEGSRNNAASGSGPI